MLDINGMFTVNVSWLTKVDEPLWLIEVDVKYGRILDEPWYQACKVDEVPTLTKFDKAWCIVYQIMVDASSKHDLSCIKHEQGWWTVNLDQAWCVTLSSMVDGWSPWSFMHVRFLAVYTVFFYLQEVITNDILSGTLKVATSLVLGEFVISRWSDVNNDAWFIAMVKFTTRSMLVQSCDGNYLCSRAESALFHLIALQLWNFVPEAWNQQRNRNLFCFFESLI